MRRAKKTFSTALIPVVCMAALFARSAVSQTAVADTCVASVTEETGTLHGHTFIPTTFIKDPFVRTFVRTSLGFGMTPEIIAPIVTIQGRTIMGSRGSLLFAVLDAEYQQALRSWIALRLRMRTVGRMANETPALVSQGVTLFTGFELGWLAHLTASDRFSLSGSLTVKNSSMTDVYLQRFIDGIIEEGEVTRANQLVETTPVLRAGVGAHGAYAITNVTGLTFSGEIDYGEQVERGESDRWYYRVAAAVDFDFGVDGGAPIGLVAGLSSWTSPESQMAAGNSTQSFFGRIAYTGTRAFALGLDLSYDLIPIRGLEEKQGFISAQLDIRLFF